MATGWLAAQSSFEPQDEGFLKRTMRASAVSIGLHVVLAIVVLLVLAAKPVSDALRTDDKLDIKVVCLQQPGPGAVDRPAERARLSALAVVQAARFDVQTMVAGHAAVYDEVAPPPSNRLTARDR